MDRFDDLVSRSMDDRLASDEETELAALLEDPERARAYAEVLRIDREVSGLLAAPVPDEVMVELVEREIAPARRPRRRFRPARPSRPGPWALAAAAFAAAALAAVAFRWEGAPSRPASERPTVRTHPEPSLPETVEAPEAAPPRSPDRPEAPVPPEKPIPAPRSAEPAAEPPVAPPPAPAPPAREPAPVPPARPVETRPAVATLDRVDGKVDLDGKPARPGEPLFPGQALHASGAASRAALRFEDGTRLEIGAGARVRHQADKNFSVETGSVWADVVRQPADRPLVLETPHARARVLGTRFTLAVAADSTRLEVREGRVRLTRLPDKASAEVGADHFAVAAKGIPLAARPINLLANPGFEEGVAGWRWPLPVASTAVRAGKGAQEIQALASLVENSQDVAVTAGAPYGLSGWIRTQSLSGKGAALWLVWSDGAGSLHTDRLGAVRGTKPWTKVSGIFAAPPGAARVRVILAVEGGSGTAWFDDLEFVRAGP